jgi:hypothetical protein
MDFATELPEGAMKACQLAVVARGKSMKPKDPWQKEDEL